MRKTLDNIEKSRYNNIKIREGKPKENQKGMEIMKKNAEELKGMIKKYNIRMFGEDKIAIDQNMAKRNPSIVPIIKENKEEIIALIKQEKEDAKKAYEERKAKIAAIEGLDIILNAMEDLESWREEFQKSFENVGGLGVRNKPEYNLDELKKSYPRAAAYLKAESYEYSSNYTKSSIGSRAKERIINGEDHEAVITQMDQEWKEHLNNHLFD